MKFNLEDLVRVVRRDKNSIRPYLYVNPLQGKHIPVNPRTMQDMCVALAELLNKSYSGERLLIIGFAETATAIAACVAEQMENVLFFQCTTREYDDSAKYIYFTESHSHAIEQRLNIVGYDNILCKIDRVVFVEDEVTTGNTICKLIEALNNSFSGIKLKFAIASVLNSMTKEREQELEDGGIPCIYLKKLPFEYKIDSISKINKNEEFVFNVKGLANVPVSTVNCGGINPRSLVSMDDYRKYSAYFAETVCSEMKEKIGGRTLIVGTEEFMYPAVKLGARLIELSMCDEIYTHSTTRSPIIPSDAKEYPLHHRYNLRSVYEEDRTTYIYNLAHYDTVIVVTDAQYPIMNDLDQALRNVGNTNIFYFGWG